MTQRFRARTGGRIDRSTNIRFRFDGLELEGHPGDTLASALLANGVHLVGRSFKYHRPRGIMAVGSEEPNALVTIDRGGGRITPNLRATQIELYEGLTAFSQNRRPNLRFDIGAIAGAASRLLPAGFYYKTFMWPRWAWRRIYEPLIRRAAGLGKAPREPDPDTYANRYAHCDVLVIGGGPAGLAAAIAAAQTGARVMICDEQAELGGSLLSEAVTLIDGFSASHWMTDQIAALAARRNVRVLSRATAFGMFAQNFVAIAERLTDHLATPATDAPRERLWQVRARRIVLATGAIERPLVFPGNDRPGVMLADAARVYLNRYGVVPGSRIVVVATHDSAYSAARNLQAAGATVELIVDLRTRPSIDVASLAPPDVEIVNGATIVGTSGRQRIRFVDIRDANGHRRTIACDLLLMSGGWTPTLHLLSQARGSLRWDAGAGAFLPNTLPPGMRCVGACNGTHLLRDVLDQSHAAGGEAAAECGFTVQSVHRFDIEPSQSHLGTIAVAAAPSLDSKAFVDFQNDVTAADIRLAIREGFRSIEHIKRYTTAGMATDQGKTSGLNALTIAADELDRPIGDVGLTTFRQPFTPVTFGTLAGAARGDLFEPVRFTPSHDWAVAQGAIFEDAGQWKRVSCFIRPREDSNAAGMRECRTVRSAAGIFDASTLGKIDVSGPDALEFLNRIYINDFSKLAVGRCRYAVMLTESGFVMDDGIVARIAPDRFHVTTTSGGISHVLAHMEDFRQTEFTDLRVWLTDVTEQWSAFAVQGPRAREVVAALVENIDLSPNAMPHMSVRDARLAGEAIRLMRVSFTGETGFEINVPSGVGPRVWEMLCEHALRIGGCAYGLDALNVLRAEKGYIIVGQETDGSTTPDDLGMSRMIGKLKPDFVGKRSLTLPHLESQGRRQLVGLLTVDAATILEEGAQITDAPNAKAGAHALGHVTTACFSPTRGRPIALALVENGRALIGQNLFVPMPQGSIVVEVVSPVFHDPAGSALDG